MNFRGYDNQLPRLTFSPHLSGDTPGKDFSAIQPSTWKAMYCKLTTGCELSLPATGHSTGCMSHTEGEFQMQTLSALLPASEGNTEPSQTVWVGKSGHPKYPSGAPAGLATSLQPPEAWVAALAAFLSARPFLCPQSVHSNPPQPLRNGASPIPSH